MSSREYDAVIVGAGTAGTITAITLAEKNAKVLLIDSKEKKWIGKKVCGDALGLHHIDCVKLPFPPKETFRGRYKASRVYSPSAKYSVFMEGEGLALERHRFGQWLLGIALDKGAELIDNLRAEKLSFQNGKAIELKIVNTETQTKEYVRAKYFVDASGMNGILRRQIPETLGVDREIPMQDLEVLYREIRRVDKVKDPDIAKIFLDVDIAPGGYWWYFPQDEHTVNLGVGIQGGKNINPKDQLKRIVNRRDDLRNSEVLDEGGGIVTTRRSLYTLVTNNILFAGDSAYNANPISGGGIGSSMRAGKACGQAISEALNSQENEKEKLWEANKTYVRIYGAKAASLDIFRLFLQALTNEEIEFGMMKKIVTDKDITGIGYGTADLSIKDKALKILRGMSRPGVLKNIVETAKYMKHVKKEYYNYPDYKNFPAWVQKVEGMFREYSTKYLLK